MVGSVFGILCMYIAAREWMFANEDLNHLIKVRQAIGYKQKIRMTNMKVTMNLALVMILAIDF